MATTGEPALPMPLTHAQSVELRRRIDQAITTAAEDFTLRSGADRRAVAAELTMGLARTVASMGLDMVGAEAFRHKINQLEAELAKVTHRP